MSALKDKSPSEHEGQFLYRGKWVDKKHFRAFVYGDDVSTVANSYEHYVELIATGLWFDEPMKKEVKNAKPRRKRVRK